MATGTGLAAISDALLAMNSTRQVRDVLQTIVGSARELLNARYAALGVPDGAGGFAQFLVSGMTERQWRAIGPLPRQHGLLAAMLRQAEPERVADIRRDPRFEGWPDTHPEMRGFLGMPIVDGEQVLGALFLADKLPDKAPGRSTDPPPAGRGRPRDGSGGTGTGRPRGDTSFTGEDEELLRLLARHAAIALTNAHLLERSRELSIAEERARIAHELHDAVAQKLFSLRLTARAAAGLLTRDPARAAAELSEVNRLAAEAADELRAVVVELRPAALEEDGLVAVLDAETRVLDRAHPARVAFECLTPGALTPDREEALLRVAREALHNALRHADPQRVDVTLDRRGGRTVLRVIDDGAGFDPDTVRRAGRRLGLVSMRDRAQAVGGTLTITSAPGRGTVVEMEVPGG
ncbi:GAF domain-containing sensor histidine kinase [Streptomyces sp. ST2-7A]|uniref:GAF domain-containing sensor histidine kinase n=1 Tax=Streptomyces sp. ST2-7A TaxID=2907214 RepID=UPI001F35257B|nr:GAF domain-containing sensor histidine kinase [Streptomyces sp. ST2-7A]MCE7082259.1 GAF domain-containing sensor histidine kinase [Streptomyces sp. ST2-7A]